ncbi:RnfH family protein [Acinetobacter pittii]|uniref:RnfH family protein n=1 Tax=Acinetobacter pittii TaxID=48296 RepID=UPI00070F0BF7|nr:RnfH family protein [Acinetobacter pittii]KRI63265.1 RnfH family ubiquitin [Acinetobacter pittii]MDO7537085.1 RnfH family protein [Acinetobacter pittii]MDX8163739.1 RnfH family protein [Acinetobacter pittii]OTS53337.1 RnfH family protein [Acinetobacter pittii]WPP87661.1 RnfH family protein [Acinetobacter pittii]
MEKAQQVWVAYAAPEQQFLVAIPFEAGMTALQAVEASGLRTQVSLPEPLQLGIFGAKVEAHAILQAGDRVEVYRPLTINPKDIRRKRAEKNPVGRYIKSNRFKQ